MTTLKKLTLITAASSLAIVFLGAMPEAEAAKVVLKQFRPTIAVGRGSGLAAPTTIKRIRQLRTRSGNSFRRAVIAPKNKSKNARSFSRGAASVAQFKLRTVNPGSTTGSANLKTNTGPVKDIYCGGHNQVPCDYIFTNYCALIGGVLSPSGTTCYHSTEW